MTVGYDLYGKTIKLDKEFQPKRGDIIKLVNMGNLPNIETINWITCERSNPQVGDRFVVSKLAPNDRLILNGLLFAHPTKRFERL